MLQCEQLMHFFFFGHTSCFQHYLRENVKLHHKTLWEREVNLNEFGIDDLCKSGFSKPDELWFSAQGDVTYRSRSTFTYLLHPLFTENVIFSYTHESSQQLSVCMKVCMKYINTNSSVFSKLFPIIYHDPFSYADWPACCYAYFFVRTLRF